jgi:hypothetical protein
MQEYPSAEVTVDEAAKIFEAKRNMPKNNIITNTKLRSEVEQGGKEETT